MLMYRAGAPFYGRALKLSDPTCADRGCAIASEGYSSDCGVIATAPSVIPYFEIQGLQDSSRGAKNFVETWRDIKTSSRSLMLSDGKLPPYFPAPSHTHLCDIGSLIGKIPLLTLETSSTLTEYDDPVALKWKSNRALDLCMGGVSVFGMEFDNGQYDLTYALWDVGSGLVKSAADIALGTTTTYNQSSANDAIRCTWQCSQQRRLCQCQFLGNIAFRSSSTRAYIGLGLCGILHLEQLPIPIHRQCLQGAVRSWLKR